MRASSPAKALWLKAGGYESFWLPENHFGGDTAIPDPLMLLAAVAANTETIRLGTTSLPAARCAIPCRLRNKWPCWTGSPAAGSSWAWGGATRRPCSMPSRYRARTSGASSSGCLNNMNLGLARRAHRRRRRRGSDAIAAAGAATASADLGGRVRPQGARASRTTGGRRISPRPWNRWNVCAATTSAMPPPAPKPASHRRRKFR